MDRTSATLLAWTPFKRRKITLRPTTNSVKQAKSKIMAQCNLRFQTIMRYPTCLLCSTSLPIRSKSVFISLSESVTMFPSGISLPLSCRAMSRPCRLLSKKRICIRLSREDLGWSSQTTEVTFQNLSGKLIHMTGIGKTLLPGDLSMIVSWASCMEKPHF